MKIRNEALCALGKTGRTVLQIVRSFQEKILRVSILSSSHTLKNTDVINGDLCFGYYGKFYIKSQNRVAMV